MNKRQIIWQLAAPILTLLAGNALASEGLHRATADLDTGWNTSWHSGLAGLQTMGLSATLFGALLWSLGFLRKGNVRQQKQFEVVGLILGFFGAASIFLRALPSLVSQAVTAWQPATLGAVVLMLLFLTGLFLALRAAPQGNCSALGRTRRPGLALITCAWLALLTVLIAVPLAGALSLVWNRGGTTTPLALFGIDHLLAPRYWSLRCLSGSGSCGSAVNSIGLGSVVAIAASLLGLSLALYVHRTSTAFRTAITIIVCLPMVTPPFLVGLGLSQVFGQAGVVSLLLESTLGIARSRWFFGGYGLVMAQMLAFFPVAYFLVLGALDSLGRTQIDAARYLGASHGQVLRTVTWPSIRDAVAVAVLVVFVESLSDIGNPLVIGGTLRVLATELFYAGSTDLAAGEMTGAPVVLLVGIALAMAFAKEKYTSRTWHSENTSADNETEPGICELPRLLRWATGGLLVASLLLMIAVYATIGIGAFSQGGLASGTYTLENFSRGFGLSFADGDFRLIGTGWPSLLASLTCALIVAPLSAVLGMSMVWVLRRGGLPCGRLVERISSYLLSVPSIVIGAGFVLAFGHLGLSTTAAWLLILLAMSIRNLAVCMRFGGVALGRIDHSLGEISGLFGASPMTTFSRVVAPLLRSTFIVCVAYSFVRSLTMLGSVLLLSSVENQVATTYMIDRIGIGEYGVSMAYGVILAAGIAGVLIVAWLLGRAGRNAAQMAHMLGDLQAAVIPARKVA